MSNTLNPLEFYKNRILYRSMPQLEKLLGDKLFHESYPELERQFWDAVDTKNIHSLRVINEHLNKEIDRAEEVINEFK